MKHLKWFLIAAAFALPLTACQVTKGKQDISTATAGPVDMAFLDGTTMVVSNSNAAQTFFSNGSLGIVDITDPLHPNVIGSATTPLFNGRLAYDPVALPHQLFVTNRESFNNQDVVDAVFRYDTQNPRPPTFLESLSVGNNPFGITIVPAGANQGQVLAANASSAFVSYFDGNVPGSPVNAMTLAVTGASGSSCTEIAASPGGDWAVVTCVGVNTVFVLDLTPPDDFTVEAVLLIQSGRINVTNFREILWLDDHRFALASKDFGRVFVIDLTQIIAGGPLPDDNVPELINLDSHVNNQGITEVLLDPGGGAYSMARVGNRLFVSQYNFNQVVEVDLQSMARVGTAIPTGGQGPVAVRIAPGNQYLYVANQVSNQIGIIDLTTSLLVNTWQ